MKEVILTKGIPGSGKSTWAKKQQELYPGKYKVICKDDLRAMLDDGRHTSKNESFVIKVRDDLILKCLDAGYSVIISDTNLNPVHEVKIRNLVDDKAEVKIQDFTDVPLEVCIERDLKRTASVGESVVRSMYMQFVHKYPKVEFSPTLLDAIIVDLDGTLAIHNGRDPYDFDKCDTDDVNFVVAEICNRFKDTHELLFVSGRDDSCMEKSKNWIINKAQLPCNYIFMRKTGDQRKDSIVKTEIYVQNIQNQFNVSFVLDDRSPVVHMWRGLGLSVLQCNMGDF